MRIPIYYQNGEVFKTVAIDEESSIEISIMEIGSITLVFSLPEFINFPVNAFILHDGVKYIISSGIKCEMSNTRQYDYSVQFYDESSLLRRIVVRNPESGSVNFQYTAGIEEHLSIIVSNLNRNDDNKWSVGECVESAGVKYLQYSYVSCMDALDSLANLFDTEWEIDGRTIHLHKIQHNIDTPVELSYGKGNGLRPGITSEMVQAPLTRLFTQGSSRNIDMLIYGSPILLLPKSVTMRYDGEKFDGENGFD